MAREIVVNAKLRRVSVCGATETLLIDRAAAPALLPPIAAALRAGGCELRGDAESRGARARHGRRPEADWTAEYLAPILAVRVVDGLDAAIAHIAPLRLRPHRRDRDAGRGGRRALPRRSRQRDPALERLDPVRRRGRVRLRRRDRHRHRPAPRARPGRPGAAHDFKYVVRGTGQVRP